MNRETKDQMKKKRKGMNFTFGFPAIKGNPIIQIAAPNRFVIVENGIMFGSTISGT